MGDASKYGPEHRKLRAEWKRRIESGEVVHCHHLPRCRQSDTRIYPGAPFDLGHRDDDPSQWTGPEHVRCNRGTALIWKERAAATDDYAWFT